MFISFSNSNCTITSATYYYGTLCTISVSVFPAVGVGLSRSEEGIITGITVRGVRQTWLHTRIPQHHFPSLCVSVTSRLVRLRGHSVCPYVRFWGVGLPDRCWTDRTKVTSSAQHFVPCERDTVTRCHSIPSPASLPIHLFLVETAIKAIVLSSFKPSHWWTKVQTRISASCIS